MVKFTWRVWLLIICLVLSLLVLAPSFEKGVIIKSVERNSSSFEAGLRQGDIITSINGKIIKNVQDYSNATSSLFPTKEKGKIEIKTKTNDYLIYTNETIKITVQDIPRTKIKTGLDLQGGSRALIKPEKQLTSQEMNDLIAISENRLNVYGISDVKLREVTDLSGNSFMSVEIAGATPSDLRELIGKQGKFEAKIGNETVFVGGKQDITSVCRNDATCAGIERCYETGDGGYACRFSFVIYLSEDAAKRHADITSKLGINITEYGRYLDKKLELFVDDKLVDSLLISEDLKGRVTTKIQVQGSGSGATREDAFADAQSSMNKLQTILITGSLPYKLEIVKLDTISPLLGEKFTLIIIITGFLAMFLVALVIFIRYKKIKASLLLLLTSFSEVVIILGVAALIKWNLDLLSIAGILVTIGTGIDQQIIILDEARISKQLSMKERLKRALFIVLSAYFTALVSLLPLYWAGAGLVKGFAVTTMIGITVGVTITRPAFADMIKNIDMQNGFIKNIHHNPNK